MNLLRSLQRSVVYPRYPSYPYDELQDALGNLAAIPRQTLGFKQEEIRDTFTGRALSAYMGNGVVFACMEARRRLFSQARFQFQQIRGGTPGDLFGTKDLEVLEHPWPHAVTSDLLNRVIQDADLAGNSFLHRLPGNRIHRLRPDWVTLIAASQAAPDQGMAAIDAEVVGLAYWPGGKAMAQEPVILLRDEFAHFMPTPDPMATFRGMSWLTPVLREIEADGAATTHKLKFFENGATPNMVVSLDPAITLDKFNAWVEKMEQGHTGVLNAYKTLYLGGGADATVVGANLRQLDFKVTQGAGETRIAAAAGVPPIIVGLSEGLAAATYSNYGQARRAFSDGTMWDLWGNIAGTLETIVPPPAGSRLWVDDRQIRFAQEDQLDAAEIINRNMTAIESGIRGGYEPDSVVKAVVAGDLSLLRHMGLYSVQLQPPSDGATPAPPSTGRAAAEAARQALVASGVVRPTQAQIAEHLGVSDRTLRRWGDAAA